jgi:hypothetical protein
MLWLKMCNEITRGDYFRTQMTSLQVPSGMPDCQSQPVSDVWLFIARLGAISYPLQSHPRSFTYLMAGWQSGYSARLQLKVAISNPSKVEFGSICHFVIGPLINYEISSKAPIYLIVS